MGIKRKLLNYKLNKISAIIDMFNRASHAIWHAWDRTAELKIRSFGKMKQRSLTMYSVVSCSKLKGFKMIKRPN